MPTQPVWASLLPVLIALALLKLAISEGGRDPQALTLSLTAFLVLTAILVLARLGQQVAGFLPLLLVVLAAGVSSLTSVRPDSSLRELLLWVGYVSLFAVTASTLNTWIAARRFVDALVLIAGWVCLIALYLFWGANDPGMRWYATFYWPNPFAAFLLLVIPVELSRVVHAAKWHDVLAHSAMLILLGVPFVLTYSRGAWLTLAATVPVLALLARTKARSLALARLLIVGVGVLAAAIFMTKGAALDTSPQAVLGRALSVANASDNSAQGRLNFWRSGLAIFWDHPLLGTGPGTYAYVHAKYQQDVRHYARDAHSLYVQTAAEMGVVGLVAVGGLLGSLLALCIRTLRRSRDTPEYSVIVGACLGLWAFLLHSALDMNWSFHANPATAVALMAVLAAYDRFEGTRDTVRLRRQRWWQWPVMVVVIAAMAAALLLWAERRQLSVANRSMRAHRWAEAVVSLRRATRLNPLNPKTYSALAVAQERIGVNRQEARRLIRRSAALDSMNASYLVQLAELVSRDTMMGHPSANLQIIELLRDALVLDPYHYPNAYALLAQTYADIGQEHRAEGLFRQARERYGRAVVEDGILKMMLWPGVAQLYLEEAWFLLSRHRLTEAEAVYREVLDLDPTYVPAYMGGADLLLRQHRRTDAVNLLGRGLQTVPTSESLWQRWRKLSGGRSTIWEQ